MEFNVVIAESDRVQSRALRRPPQDTADSERTAADALAAPRRPLDLLIRELAASSRLVPERILDTVSPRLQ